MSCEPKNSGSGPVFKKSGSLSKYAFRWVTSCTVHEHLARLPVSYIVQYVTILQYCTKFIVYPVHWELDIVNMCRSLPIAGECWKHVHCNHGNLYCYPGNTCYKVPGSYPGYCTHTGYYTYLKHLYIYWTIGRKCSADVEMLVVGYYRSTRAQDQPRMMAVTPLIVLLSTYISNRIRLLF